MSSLRPRVERQLLWLMRLRFVKFGMVGASGTVVNQVVLFLAHRYLFAALEATGKPYASLALAIALATINNFTWNRLWTWADRGTGLPPTSGNLLMQLARYALASWFGIALQYVLTLWLSSYIDMLLANLISILIASVSNYLANDRWTFRRRAQA